MSTGPVNTFGSASFSFEGFFVSKRLSWKKPFGIIGIQKLTARDRKRRRGGGGGERERKRERERDRQTDRQTDRERSSSVGRARDFSSGD